MPESRLPLLLFPRVSTVKRETGSAHFHNSTHFPSAERLRERVTRQFGLLQTAFESRRLSFASETLNDDPDLVLVVETVGSTSDFATAVSRVPGLEWLLGALEDDISPDDDFYDEETHDKPLSGRIFLLGTNRAALDEIVSLWERYKNNSTVNLGHGLNAWKEVFKHLKDVRFWSSADRLDLELKEEWRARLGQGVQLLRFEIEAWCYTAMEKNRRAAVEIRRFVIALGGQVLDELLFDAIAYHGFLVEIPSSGIEKLISDVPPGLILSERIMYFRPHGQATVERGGGTDRLNTGDIPASQVSGSPIVALLDGMPVENHPRLRDRLIVDDPDNFASDYDIADRLHGTSMASLIVWGEISGSSTALPNPIYVRPLLRHKNNEGPMHRECTPDDQLLIDLVHRAVCRIFDGEGDIPAAAPSVKIINLSIGDADRPYNGRTLSPWARLLDWLAAKYSVLFIVSVGNASSKLTLQVPRETLVSMQPAERAQAALSALVNNSEERRLISPAEAINVLTVGASHADSSLVIDIPIRPVLFEYGMVAPYSCTGPGFRRAVKPDLLMPGGRARFVENLSSPPDETIVDGLYKLSNAPGHLVATPPTSTGDSAYSRGSSNAAALATRAAAHAYQVIELLRAQDPSALERKYDAVLLKAMLVHGADWGVLEEKILLGREDVDSWHRKKRFVSKYLGYGVADIEKALSCTEQRATLLGVGELKNEKAMIFRVPVPPSLNALREKRRLTVTLAWLSPVNPRNSNYRVAKIWAEVVDNTISPTRIGAEWRQARAGTLQHEIFEGHNAVPIPEGDELIIKVNCVRDAGRIQNPIAFALCVSLEVAEGVNLPIYQEIRNQVSLRVGIRAG